MRRTQPERVIAAFRLRRLKLAHGCMDVFASFFGGGDSTFATLRSSQRQWLVMTYALVHPYFLCDAIVPSPWLARLTNTRIRAFAVHCVFIRKVVGHLCRTSLVVSLALFAYLLIIATSWRASSKLRGSHACACPIMTLEGASVARTENSEIITVYLQAQ